METVIITGCNGFIGKKLTKHLLDKGIFVYGLDIFSTQAFENYSNFKFIPFDLSKDFTQIIERNVDVLYHLAWCGVSTVDKNDPDKQFKNIGITYKVLELAKAIHANKVVIPGSMSEFSRCTKPVTGYEQDTPADLYAATKVAIRKISYQYCEKNGLDLNWLLITSVFSIDRVDANLITYTINNLLDNKAVETTKLEQLWDYISIEDLVRAMFIIGENGSKGLIYPIGSGEVHQLSYYIDLIATYMNKKNLLRIGAVPYKNKYIDNSVPDITALEHIGYIVQDNFKDYIVKLIVRSSNK